MSIRLATQVAVCIQFLTPKRSPIAQSNCVRQHLANAHMHAVSRRTCLSLDSLQQYDIWDFACAILCPCHTVDGHRDQNSEPISAVIWSTQKKNLIINNNEQKLWPERVLRTRSRSSGQHILNRKKKVNWCKALTCGWLFGSASRLLPPCHSLVCSFQRASGNKRRKPCRSVKATFTYSISNSDYTSRIWKIFAVGDLRNRTLH